MIIPVALESQEFPREATAIEPGDLMAYIETKMGKKGLFDVDFRKLAEVSSLGLMLPSSIAVGLLLGYFLDKLLGTHPWLLIVFLLLGVASGFFSLVRGVNKYLDKNRDI